MNQSDIDSNEVASATVDETEDQAVTAQTDTDESANDSAQTIGQSTDVNKFEIPPDMAKVVNLRLSVLIRLQRLENTRQQMVKSDQLSSRAELEITRQQRELQRLPNADIVTPALENLEKKLADAQRIYELQQSGELDAEQAAQQLADDGDEPEVQVQPDEQEVEDVKPVKPTEHIEIG